MASTAHREALARGPRGELASRTLAMPANTNPHGDIFGGWIMALMDAAASMTAATYSERSVVTVAVTNILFLQPVQVGDAVCCYTDPVRVGRTSVTLNVEVWVRRHGREVRIPVTQAEFTFVALNDEGRPASLNPKRAPANSEPSSHHSDADPHHKH
jgi:acyl-CoA thioesterase YciA